MSYTCNFCKNTNFREHINLTKRIGALQSSYRVVNCTSCNLYSLYPLPNDEQLTIIYENYAIEGNRIEVEKIRQLDIYPNKIRKILKYIPDNENILDIGAGIGGFINIAKQHGFKSLVGLEMETKQTILAKELYNIDLINLSFDDFVIQNTAKFSAVHMHHVLEHMRDPLNTLKRIKSIVKHRGILILEVPNQFFVFPKEIYLNLGISEELKPYNPFHHLYFFSPRSLRRLLVHSGFEILEFNIHPKDKIKFISRMKVTFGKIFGLATSTNIEVICKVVTK